MVATRDSLSSALGDSSPEVFPPIENRKSSSENPLPVLRLATRGSPLALAQTVLVEARLRALWPTLALERVVLTTSGDARRDWSLERQGGAGLFTAELEVALREGRADLAVHSAKDLPTSLAEGLVLATCLPRAPAHDVLVRRRDVAVPATIATGSPRRRVQLARLFPQARFTELRGNVDTRLRKIAGGEAEATVLAAAGLHRLGLAQWPGLSFCPLPLATSVPAPGQGAIALECRAELAAALAVVGCPATTRAVLVERAWLGGLGGGCQSALAAHCRGTELLVLVPGEAQPQRHALPADAEAAIAASVALARRLPTAPKGATVTA